MCNISLAYDSRTNVYLVLYGYMQGLYATEYYPETGCTLCKQTALPFSQMLWAISNILTLFKELVGNDLGSMSTFDQLDFLYNSFLAFWEFGINFDYILIGEVAIIQYRQFLNVVSDDFLNVLRTNVLSNLSALNILFTNLDFKNSECRKSGVIGGALIRKVFSFQLRE